MEIDNARFKAELSTLPPEIILLILSHLNPPSLARCQRVCKKWRNLASEEEVWRQIAFQHAYSDERQRAVEKFQDLALEDDLAVLTTTSGHNLLQKLPEETIINVKRRQLDHAETRYDFYHDSAAFRMSSVTHYYSKDLCRYQQLCKEKWCLDRAWQCPQTSKESAIHMLTGEGFSIPSRLEPAMRNLDAAPPYVGPGWHEDGGMVEEVGRDVWRIKIDPIDNLLISSGQRGGIRVVDIMSGEVLWRLDRQMTRNFPHIEYDRGQLIFDRIGHGLEIWRKSWLTGVGGRGEFRLHSSLSSPHSTRAFRFQFPTLAVATSDDLVLMWDVEKEKIFYEYSLEATMHTNGNINYIDFDDDFVFLAGTGAKCVTVISRALGKVIWTLADYFEAGLEAPQTYVLEEESSYVPARYASLERRRLKSSTPSPWQKRSGPQNLAQLLMTPIQSWSAIHPDHRSRTLVILGQTNVLIIRDYLTCFLAWQRKKEQELLGKVLIDEASDTNNLTPSLFADVRFAESREGEADFSWDELPTSQLAVAESRAMCIVGKPMLLDLDPLRMIRNDLRSIDLPKRVPSNQVVDLVVTDAEAGFAVYNTVKPSHDNQNAEHARNSSLETCSCVMMDSTSAYAVQVHEAGSNPFDEESSTTNLAMTEYHDVLVWDFSKRAREFW